MNIFVNARIALTLLVLLLVNVTRAGSSFTFVQITDPHIGIANGAAGYAQALAEAKALHPAFVVVTGDLADGGSGEWDAQMATFIEISKTLSPTRLVVVPGNHDVSNNSDPDSVSNYLAKIRQLNQPQKEFYSFSTNKCLFIVLNSTAFVSHEQSITNQEDQFNFLSTELASPLSKRANHRIIFMHHPLFEFSPDEADPDYGRRDVAGENTFPPSWRRRMLDLLTTNHVEFVFAGHLHENGVGRFGKLEMVTTSSISEGTGPGGRTAESKRGPCPNFVAYDGDCAAFSSRERKRVNDAPGFRIVTVAPNFIRHEYKLLDTAAGDATSIVGKNDYGQIFPISVQSRLRSQSSRAIWRMSFFPAKSIAFPSE